MNRTKRFLAVILGLFFLLVLGGVLVALFGGPPVLPVAQQPYPVGTAVPTTVKVPTATPLPTPMAPAYPGPATPARPVTPPPTAAILSSPPTPPGVLARLTPTRIVVPTPAQPAQAETYVAREVVVARVGSGLGEIGIFHGGPEQQRAGPESLAVDRDGNVYILDTINFRTVVFDRQGMFLRILPGVTGGDICVDEAGAVYALVWPEAVRKFDRDGKLVREYRPSLDMQMSHIALDARGYLLADNGSYAIILGTTEQAFTLEQQAATQKRGRLCRAGVYTGYFYGLGAKTGSFQVEVYADTLRQTEGRQFVLPIEADRTLISIDFFDVDGVGNVYLGVYLQEKLDNEHYILHKEMRKYTAQGQLVARFLLPKPYVISYHGIIVDEGGTVYQLLPSKDAVKVVQWQREQ